MKKALTELKKALLLKYGDESLAFESYMKEVFEKYDDIWQISEAFYFYYDEERRKINKDKRQRQRVKSHDLHIATQFFTPKWLVEYITDNSLGRFLPDISKRFLDGEHFVCSKEVVTVFDPAVGTGNMLVYAYDLLQKHYLAKGFKAEDIPPLILDNLYGLDIDDRAVSVAKKLLLKKSGLKNFDFHIYSFEDIDNDLIEKAEKEGFVRLSEFLSKHRNLKQLGSIIKVYEELADDIELFMSRVQEKEKNILKALALLTKKYHVILLNPPYLSSSDYNEVLKSYIYAHYEKYKYDLFAVFIVKSLSMLEKGGFMGVVCPYNWMFIKSFYNLRKFIVDKKGIFNVLQLSNAAYNRAVVYLSAFVLSDIIPEKGSYIRLTSFKGKEQEQRALEAVKLPKRYKYNISQNIFKKTPLYNLIYWTNDNFIANFSHRKLGEFLEIRQGMATGDNKKFLRKIEDINPNDIAFEAESIEHFDSLGKKYALYNKGGKYRKWYGNVEYVIAFDKKSRKQLQSQGNRMPSRQYYFKECITWTLVSSKGHFGARYSKNSVFDVGGSCAFVKLGSPVSIYVFLGFLCSNTANLYLNALNPTLNAQVGDIKNLPFLVPDEKSQTEIEALVKENIDIAQRDWYNKSHKNDFGKMKANEERINEIFIKLYKLEKLLNKSVPDNLITLRRDNEE
ncbi:MAG: Eco57I restriction-modification methylase domain-containing protein [Christensenellales bacterium]|jgi:hypothetical protein|nr:N-6 DNA methylase [Clostridiales bacterium]